LSVLIDVSISQDVAVPTTKAIGLYFVKSILRQGKDEAAIATFTGKVSVLQPLTTNLQNAQLAIHRLEFVPPPGYVAGDPIRSLSSSSKSKSDVGSTAIWDAISFTCEHILLPPATPTKQVIVLLTDGVDSSSKHKIDQAIELAVRHNVIVYAIGVGDDHYFGLDEDPLRKVSKRTGGRAFFPKKVMDLPGLFEEVEHELRNQYIVTFSPTSMKSDNLYRKLKIEVVNPQKRNDKLTLTYRPGYYPKGM
jgi:VWFA-related protein